MSEEKTLRKVDAPIMGVREWAVGDDGSLNSTGVDSRWEPRGTQSARCLRTSDVSLLREHYNIMLMTVRLGGPQEVRRLAQLRREIAEAENGGHSAPHQGCGCGLYAFYDRDSCEEYGDGVAKQGGVRGVVSAWGKVIRAEYGFKAQYMRLEAIILERETMEHFGATVGLEGAHKNLADRHGVPLIKPEEVSAFVQLSGGTVLEPEPAPPEEPAVSAIFPIYPPSSSANITPSKLASTQVAREVARQFAAMPPPFVKVDAVALMLIALIVCLVVGSLLISTGSF